MSEHTTGKKHMYRLREDKTVFLDTLAKVLCNPSTTENISWSIIEIGASDLEEPSNGCLVSTMFLHPVLA